MKTVTFKGVVYNASGCAISLILFNGNTNAVIWIHHYYNSFEFSCQLASGKYNLSINGITLGSLVFDISGDISNITPQKSQSYNQKVSDSYNFNIE